jgi:hypothetical protein
MRLPLRLSAALALAWAAAPGLMAAQPRPASANVPPRAIRRDIPMTNAIRRAMAAGSRDSTGRPTAKYWQLRTDYDIDVSLDPASARLSGTARITVHNTSPDPLREIGLRLHPNHFIGTAPHSAPWVPAEVTDGMAIARMTVDGAPVNIRTHSWRPPMRRAATRCSTGAARALAFASPPPSRPARRPGSKSPGRISSPAVPAPATA